MPTLKSLSNHCGVTKLFLRTSNMTPSLLEAGSVGTLLGSRGPLDHVSAGSPWPMGAGPGCVGDLDRGCLLHQILARFAPLSPLLNKALNLGL